MVLINQHFPIKVSYFGAITVLLRDEVEVISCNSLRNWCVCLCSTGM